LRNGKGGGGGIDGALINGDGQRERGENWTRCTGPAEERILREVEDSREEDREKWFVDAEAEEEEDVWRERAGVRVDGGESGTSRTLLPSRTT
jgi:hypothetical protein